MHIAAALSANRLCCAGDLGQHPFSELDVLRFIDRCGGYFGHPFLHHRFVRWTRLPTTSLLLETLADLGRNRSELLVENACLRQQLIILRRQVKRLVYTGSERLLFILLARAVRTWRQALFIIQPKTLLRWHRELFHLFWKH
jgi:hypothetical protein